MLDVGFVAGLPAPLGCALREVPEAGFAFEAILVVEAIAELSVKNARCGTVAQKSDGVRLPRSRIPLFASPLDRGARRDLRLQPKRGKGREDPTEITPRPHEAEDEVSVDGRREY
jgi:hypothetical protein